MTARSSPAWMACLLLTLSLPAGSAEPGIDYARTGTVNTPALDEMSGLQASRRNPGVLWTHNDDGPARLYAIDAEGRFRGHVDITGALNRDWEGLALVPGQERDVLVIGDFGRTRPENVEAVLYLVDEPVPDQGGRFHGEAAAREALPLRFPGDREDVEAMAWDPLAQQLILLAKRSQPPRLYVVDLEQAQHRGFAEMQLAGTLEVLRSPQASDRQKFGKRTPWISQPTDLDISLDGRRAAIITYRSLYLFHNDQGIDWLDALKQPPLEIIGPPAAQEEGVSFLPDGLSLVVTTEGKKAAVYTYRILTP